MGVPGPVDVLRASTLIPSIYNDNQRRTLIFPGLCDSVRGNLMNDEENVEEVKGDVATTDSQSPQAPYSAPYSQAPYGQSGYGEVQPPQMLLSTVFWKALWFLVLVGAILLLVGQILLDVADYSDEGMIKAGRVLRTISGFLIATPMIITGIYYDGTRDMVRFGLILAGAILLAFAFF